MQSILVEDERQQWLHREVRVDFLNLHACFLFFNYVTQFTAFDLIDIVKTSKFS